MSGPILDPAVVETLRQLTSPGEPDVLREVFALFLDDVPKRIERLRAAWTAQDAAGMQSAAHSLKGSAANIGANGLESVCRQLDDAGRSGELAGLQPTIDRLGVEYAKVEAEIRRLLG